MAALRLAIKSAERYPQIMKVSLAALLLAFPAHAAPFSDDIRAVKFIKGNLHAHSNSQHGAPGKCLSYADGCGDGDSDPAAVASWYAAAGYGFAALTDHNELTATTGLPGVELTSYYGPKKLPVHVNAICVAREAKGVRDSKETAAAVLRQTIAAARSAGAALVIVNHPTYAGALGKAELTSVAGYDALEIASGHPKVTADDAAASENAESLWDDALTAGLNVWAVAADDAHDFTGALQAGESELRPPGRAWVQVWADSADGVCDALKNGRFYASTGPELKSLTVHGNEIGVEVAGSWDAAADKIEFLKKKTGPKENVASASTYASAKYLSDGTEGYVRVRITQAGRRAWTQAYRVK